MFYEEKEHNIIENETNGVVLNGNKWNEKNSKQILRFISWRKIR